MSVKISMALSEEAGLSEWPPLVARCTLDFEEESSQPKDFEIFQRNVHRAIAACCRTVHGELRRQQQRHIGSVCPNSPPKGAQVEFPLGTARG
jgi:hypothetical protein